MDLDTEEDFLLRCLAKLRLERTRRKEEAERTKYDQERLCKKKYWPRRDDGSDGASGTTV